MIISKCPLRISLAGGSTDQDSFIDKFGYGSVISFPCNIYTYIYLHRDKLGYNNDGYYIINYSKKEIKKNIDDIENDIAREALKYFMIQPIGITFYSDIYSSGSGLASSSSYTNAILKCLINLKSKTYENDNYSICNLSYMIEKKFNHFLGQQDSYGCGIGGLKKMIFYKNETPKISLLNSNIFNKISMFLIPTGIVRKSTKVLESLNFENKRLLDLVFEMEKCLLDSDEKNFHEIINEGWIRKKETSKLISKNLIIKNIDDSLTNNKKVLSHRLCGAGNGGFFLVFTNIEKFDEYNSIPISIDDTGISCYKF